MPARLHRAAGLFQHRNSHKWRADGPQDRVAGFLEEERCIGFLQDLEQRWIGRPGRRYRDDLADPDARRTARDLCGRRWTYRRVGYDERAMTFNLDGTIGEGAAGCEWTWRFAADVGVPTLVISGRDGTTCVLMPHNAGWLGRWVIHECMPVYLVADDSG